MFWVDSICSDIGSVGDPLPTEPGDDVSREEKLAQLLRLARCPNNECDQMGCIAREGPGYDGEKDVIFEECQWCDEREAALKE